MREIMIPDKEEDSRLSKSVSAKTSAENRLYAASQRRGCGEN